VLLDCVGCEVDFGFGLIDVVSIFSDWVGLVLLVGDFGILVVLVVSRI